MIRLKTSKLLHKAIVWISLFALRLHELEGIFELHREEAHNEHDYARGRSRHTHCAVNQALGIKVGVLLVNRSKQLLNANIFTLLLTCLDLSPALLEVYLQNLV